MRKLTASNMVFLLLSAVFVTAGAAFQRRDINTGIVLTEVLIVLLPAIVFSRIYTESTAGEFLKMKRFRLSTLFKAVVITFLTYPMAVFANILVMTILSLFKQPDIPQVPIASDFGEYFLYIAIIGILPGICEEILFRGFFLSMNKELGIRNSILFTGFLFALFHYNVYNFAGPLVLGVVFGYITIITKSIWPAAICHALNNSIASTLGFWAIKSQENMGDAGQGILDQIPFSYILIVQSVFWGAISIACYKGVRSMIRRLEDDYGVREEIENEEKSLFPFLDVYSFAPILICIALYIYITAMII